MELEIVVDKIDIEILYYFYTNNKFSSLNSCQLKPIIKHFEEANYDHPPAYTTLLRRLNILVTKELLNLGYKVKNSNTYFITGKGKSFIEKNIIEKEDIFEYIPEDEIEGEA